MHKWDPRGFGFLTLEDGRAAYVHASQCKGMTADGPLELQVGETVSAILRPDRTKMGRLAAHDVCRGAYTGEAASVSEWNTVKGYGFVVLDDGRKAYVHRSGMGDLWDLVEGQRVQVKVKEDQRNFGKLAVSQLTLSEGGAAAMPESLAGTEPPAKRQCLGGMQQGMQQPQQFGAGPSVAGSAAPAAAPLEMVPPGGGQSSPGAAAGGPPQDASLSGAAAAATSGPPVDPGLAMGLNSSLAMGLN